MFRNDARAASVALLAYEAERPEQDPQLSVQDSVPIVRDVLVISGPCGAGKSTAGFECLELLEAGGVAAAMIDAELAYFHPKPDDDPQGTRVAEQALAAVAPVYAAAGIERLLLPRVIERPRHLDIVRAAVPGARFQIAWLDVRPETIAERLAAREVGSGLDWHLQRAEEIRSNALAHDLFDFIIDGDRTVREVSQDVLAHAGWL